VKIKCKISETSGKIKKKIEKSKNLQEFCVWTFYQGASGENPLKRRFKAVNTGAIHQL